MSGRERISTPSVTGQTFHVSPTGRADGDGSAAAPLGSVQAAALLAQPGDTVVIHAGVYRERVDPPRGGTSPERRITYCAAGDGPVSIKGSEVLAGWEPSPDGLWVAEVPNSLFGEFNPYETILSGHWFFPKDRLHHPGAVFLDGHWLIEAATSEALRSSPRDARLWHAEVSGPVTRFTARFGGRDPREGLVEILVRKTVFYPSQEGRNFITVRGLSLLHAATPWSPPTTEQVGLIGCHWSKGWVIEDCEVRYSACAGITLGKYHDPEDYPDRPVVEHTTGEDTYHGTIRRAIGHGWSLEAIGGHVVRNCVVSHCEMAGICGSLGAANSRIEGNTVHDIHVHQLFGGFEQAGIKFHGAIDSVIARNRVFRCYRGIWLDWMSQGTWVSRNVCHDNGPQADLFLEVNHGPFVVEGNFFLSENSMQMQSDGGAFLGNVFLGRVKAMPEPRRVTPWFRPHTAEMVGMRPVEIGDERYLCNVFAGPDGLWDYNVAVVRPLCRRNTFANGAQPSPFDLEAVMAGDAAVEVVESGDSILIRGLAACGEEWFKAGDLGIPLVSGQRFEPADARGFRAGRFSVEPCAELPVWPAWEDHE